MHHKRRRPKHRRAGCLFCKPQKRSGYSARRAAKPSDRRRLDGASTEIDPAFLSELAPGADAWQES